MKPVLILSAVAAAYFPGLAAAQAYEDPYVDDPYSLDDPYSALDGAYNYGLDESEMEEGGIGDGIDNFLTRGIDEGAIGSGFDNPLTRDIDEGAIGSGFDNPLTRDIDEGAIDLSDEY